MGKRGKIATSGKRTQGEALNVGGDYFPPSLDLSKVAAEVWRLTVSSMPSNHFREADRPLLRAYCAATAKNIKATAELERGGEVDVSRDGREYERPWSKIQDKSAERMASLATKLRITQSSMLSAKGARREWDIAQPADDEKKWQGLLWTDESRQ